MNVNMLKKSWTWFRWTIFCLRQRQKTDDASDLRTVSERSWLRQLLSTCYDRDKKPPQDKHFPSSVLRRSYLSDLKHRKGVFVWKRDHPTSNIKLKFNINTQGISKTYSEICLHKKAEFDLKSIRQRNRLVITAPPFSCGPFYITGCKLYITHGWF